MAPRLRLGQSRQLRQDSPEGAARHPGGEDQVPDGRGRCRVQAVQATIAEIHASSMRRLSKVEAAADPTDGADEE